jgi:hypothetical protein
MSTAEMYASPGAGDTTTPTPDLLARLNSVQEIVPHFTIVGSTASAPAMTEARRAELIERLAQRSLRPDGFDRTALRDVRDCWA